MGLGSTLLCYAALLCSVLYAPACALGVGGPPSTSLKPGPSHLLNSSSSPASIILKPSSTSAKAVIPPMPPSFTAPSNNTQATACLDCVLFMEREMPSLVYLITRVGITSSCDKLCGMLNSTDDIEICKPLCAVVGIQFFWQMFVSAGINTIWACEKLNICSVSAKPAVTFSSATVTPASGPQGTTFTFNTTFRVINETGVGQTAYVVYYPIGTDFQLGFTAQQVFADYMPGDHEVSLPFTTNTSFAVGKYLVVFDICSGACGQAPDPYPFAHVEYSFNITAKP